METAMMPARAREAIFLSFIMNFSSLWCIKDRDPKQAERKVLSFQRHYSIPPPGVKARFTIFSFLFSFLYPAPEAREYIFHFYVSVYVCLCVLFLFFTECSGLGTPLSLVSLTVVSTVPLGLTRFFEM